MVFEGEMGNSPTQRDGNQTANPASDSQPQRQIVSGAPINKQPYGQGGQHSRCRKLKKAPIWVEACCAVALVGITGFYTYYARQQAGAAIKAADAAKSAAGAAEATLNEIQKGGTDTHALAVAAGNQAKSMVKQLDLQREIARLEHGAKVRVRGIAVYHDAGKISADIEVENDGKATAVQISIARKIEFRKSPPIVDLTKFEFFEPIQPSRLRPLPDNGQGADIGSVYHLQMPIPRGYSAYKSGAEDIYIWGVFSYSDFTREDVHDPFCEQISAKQVFDSPLGILPGRGAYIPPKGCPTSTARNQQPPANQPHRSNPE